MKLRRHRRESRKLADKVSAKRKSAGKIKRDSPNIPRTVRFRVEIWREEDSKNELPEIRLATFPMEYRKGDYKKADLMAGIGENLLAWIERKVPVSDRSPFDTYLSDKIWEEPEYTATDDDIPF